MTNGMLAYMILFGIVALTSSTSLAAPTASQGNPTTTSGYVTSTTRAATTTSPKPTTTTPRLTTTTPKPTTSTTTTRVVTTTTPTTTITAKPTTTTTTQKPSTTSKPTTTTTKVATTTTVPKTTTAGFTSTTIMPITSTSVIVPTLTSTQRPFTTTSAAPSTTTPFRPTTTPSMPVSARASFQTSLSGSALVSTIVNYLNALNNQNSASSSVALETCAWNATTQRSNCVVDFALYQDATNAVYGANHNKMQGVYGATLLAPNRPSDPNNSKTGVIVGCVVGDVFFFVIVIAIVTLRRHRLYKRGHGSYEPVGGVNQNYTSV